MIANSTWLAMQFDKLTFILSVDQHMLREMKFSSESGNDWRVYFQNHGNLANVMDSREEFDLNSPP